MSFASVIPYFRTQMEAAGFSEWPDAFNFENIPKTISDKAFHIEVGTVTGGPINQETTGFDFPVNIRVFFRGYRDTAQTRDDALLEVDNIYAEVLDPDNRLGTIIKNVTPDGFSIGFRTVDNDNDAILEINFTAILVCAFT